MSKKRKCKCLSCKRIVPCKEVRDTGLCLMCEVARLIAEVKTVSDKYGVGKQ